VGGGGLAVVEDDRAAVAAGQHQRLERGLVHGDAGFEGAVGLVRVDVLRQARGAQLLQGAARGTGFTAPVPDVVTVRETVAGWAGEITDRSARIRLRTGAGYPLRAKATAVRELGDGWDELDIPYGHGLDAWLGEFGPDVVVLEPDELRADVVERLRAVANG
jgi:proteasome accessory factor B